MDLTKLSLEEFLVRLDRQGEELWLRANWRESEMDREASRRLKLAGDNSRLAALDAENANLLDQAAKAQEKAARLAVEVENAEKQIRELYHKLTGNDP